MARLEELERQINAAIDGPDGPPPPAVKRHDGFVAPGLTLYRYAIDGGYSLAIHLPTAACVGDVPALVGMLAAAVTRNLSQRAVVEPVVLLPEQE